jgi:malate dehydrogenase (oxaloacetate-decarboxylating)(NADP+)
MTEFMDEFMHEMSTAFPKLLVQFEVPKSFSLSSATLTDTAGFLDRQRLPLP